MDIHKTQKWVKQNPLIAFRYGIGLVFQFLAGAALGGVLVFGPFNQGFSPWVIVGGSFSGLLFSSLFLYQKSVSIFGSKEHAHKWKLGFNFVQVTIIIVMITIVSVQLYSIGVIPGIGESREKEFARLFNALEKHYPYADLKNIDFEELRNKYGSKVTEADNDKSYFSILRQMLLQFNDAHTGLLSPREELVWFGLAEEIQGKAVVTGVRSGLSLLGLEKGAVIKRIDGLGIESYIEQVLPQQQSGSTARQQRYRAFAHLLTVSPGQEKIVILQGTDGKTYELNLNEELIYCIVSEAVKNDTATEHTPIIKGKRLSSGIGLIEIPTFGGNRRKLITEFDRALDKLLDASGIILDIRGNSGGSTFIAHPMAGRFFTEPFIYGVEYYERRLPLMGWAKEYQFAIRPRGDIYEGELVVLVDTSNMSTAENFIVAMKDSGRATIVGRPTAGSSGNPVTFNLKGGGARFSVGDLHRVDGPRIEGIGVNPHIFVEWKIKDIIEETDPDIKAAENLFGNTL